MFSGIVETIGTISLLKIKQGCHYLTITPSLLFDDLAVGDSVAINGVCLTVTDFTSHTFNVTVVPETLRLTNLKPLNLHDIVNLERSLKINARISGHHVQGHVDHTGEIIELTHDGSETLLVKIKTPHALKNYIVAKGYITLDGMSITVINATSDWFTITLIPHTQAATIAKHYVIGQLINIEVDIMGKYIEKLLGAYTHAIKH